jgi:uncharacterized protein YybS (DUF2232 family)
LSNTAKMSVIAAGFFLLPAILVLIIPKQDKPSFTFAMRVGLVLVLLALGCAAAGGGDATAYIIYIAFAPVVGILVLAPGFDLLKDHLGIRNYATGVAVATAVIGLLLTRTGLV